MSQNQVFLSDMVTRRNMVAHEPSENVRKAVHIYAGAGMVGVWVYASFEERTAKSPKLIVLDMEGREVELFLWVVRRMISLTNLELTIIEDSTGTTSMGAENSLRELVNVKENGNDQDFPLEVLVLRDFKSGVSVIELCACFVHLQDLSFVGCSALVHWPETLFEGLVSLRKLRIQECNNLTGYAQASAEPSTSSKTGLLLPSLEDLVIWFCENLVELFNVPASLRTMCIYKCSKLESTSGRKQQQGQSVSSIHQGPSSIEGLSLYNCDGLTGVLCLPPSLKRLDITNCGGFASLESRSPELQSLEFLELHNCPTLSSLRTGWSTIILISPASFHYILPWSEDTPCKPAATAGQHPGQICRCPLLWK
ncbi:uncharacterized protein LOC119338838 [Triticum dicoccoides]|uniref:uncharacterized protein LOC119338838 n=1 Tax=Triticum dicoccoides TaxID=85692 RepID=UPI0018916D83|nr:uncharacterized protein LOC119338838 [Triticum dicoccoides]